MGAAHGESRQPDARRCRRRSVFPDRVTESRAGSSTGPEKATNHSKVADLLDKAILRNPKRPLYLSRARIRFSKQDYEAALDDVTRSIELAPDDTETLKFRAILHMIQNNDQAALVDLTAAIALDANDPELLRMRAAAYRRTGNDQEADADLEAAKKLRGQVIEGILSDRRDPLLMPEWP